VFMEARNTFVMDEYAFWKLAIGEEKLVVGKLFVDCGEVESWRWFRDVEDLVRLTEEKVDLVRCIAEPL